MPTYEIRAATTESELAAAADLFREYADRLGVDLAFQDFEAEPQVLAQMYGAPEGLLLLAWPTAPADPMRADSLPVAAGPPAGDAGTQESGLAAVPVGCVAVRRLAPDECEMKRLYVRDAARGSGLGSALARAIVEAARALGYRRMRLDTLGSMAAARVLYASLGFVETGPYYDNPLPDVHYLMLDLAAATAATGAAAATAEAAAPAPALGVRAHAPGSDASAMAHLPSAQAAPGPARPPDLARDPAARRASRRPATLQVRFAATPGVVQTLEGPVRHRSGAALVCGLHGECWPVEREPFDRRYEPVDGLTAGCDGLYRRRPGVVFARRVEEALAVPVGAEGDLLHGRPGDWLLQYAPGEYGIVAPGIFCDTYELLGQAGSDGGQQP